MKTTQRITAVVLAILLVATIYGLMRTAQRAALSDAQKSGGPQAAQTELVDQSSLRNAQRLTQLADKPDEQAFAAEAVRLADHDMDVAFDIAKREVKAHPPKLSAKAQEIQARLEKAESTQKSEQAEVERLTAEEATATGSRKAALEDQLDTAKGVLESTDNEVDDASQDLIGEGGDAKWRLEQLEQQHKTASESVDNAAKVNVAQLPEQFGLIHRYQQWDALRQKEKLLAQARDEAKETAAKMAAVHDALKASLEAAKLASPDLAGHTKKGREAGAGNPRKERSHEESQAAVARVKEIVSEQMNLAAFDKRRDYQTDLATNYGQWIEAVEERQAGVMHRALQGIVIILVIGVVGVFFGSWMDKLVSRLTMDRRQVQSLHTVTRVSLQILGLLLILIVILGPPSQLGTFLGLAGAGLTVALKDFIVGFIGWFVLMGKHGIRMGDWVEINGVTGEVVQVGPFHTVLLETGNWTDSGHPTGRRVTFTNSFAIEGHYFNFSTSGQWLWDELQIVLPAGQDPYPIINAIQKKVIEATQETAEQAKQEWSRSTNSPEMGAISVAPAISVKPVVGGIEVAVRYVTRANERYALRSKLYQAAVELLGSKAVQMPAAADNPEAKKV